MTRARDNLVSPFVDGELPAGETKPGDLAPLLRSSPFVSLTLGQRRPLPVDRLYPAEAPPPEVLPPGETAEDEASPVLELAFEETREPETESVEPGELALLPDGISTDVGVATEQEGISTEIDSVEGETEANAIEEASFDFDSELELELREALELEPELESDLALQPESPFEPEGEEALGPDAGVLEPEAGAEETGGSEAGEEESEKAPGTVTLVLDQPSEADDTFTLKSRDGTYRQTLGAKDAKPLVAGVKVLRFEGADTTKEYQLLHKRSRASVGRSIFGPLAYVGLTEHHTARSARALILLPTEAPTVTSGRPVDPSLIDSSPGFVHMTDVRV
jgi:hypothetical protein